MPLLSEAFIAILQSDRAVALAAAIIIGANHSDVLEWVAKTIHRDAEPPPKLRQKRKGAARRGNGGATGKGAYFERLRAKRDRDDEALIEAMKAKPAGPIGDWAETIRKSRTSTVSALHRLRDAGRASNEDGVWALTEPSAPRVPVEKWTAPLSGRATARSVVHAGA
jgi:hypothetical protein